MPFDKAIVRQLPSIELKEPIFVSVAITLPVTIHHHANGLDNRAPLLEHDPVARLYAIDLRGDVTAERHSVPQERFAVVSSKTACFHLPILLHLALSPPSAETSPSPQ